VLNYTLPILTAFTFVINVTSSHFFETRDVFRTFLLRAASFG